jgi:hypothetical protein
MSDSTIQKLVTLRDILWVATLLIGAGMAVASFATKDQVQLGFDQARQERMNSIEKAMDKHETNQRDTMERIWKKLDQIDGKLDRIKR